MGGGPGRPQVHAPPAQGPAGTGAPAAPSSLLLLPALCVFAVLLLLLLLLLLFLLVHVGVDAEHAEETVLVLCFSVAFHRDARSVHSLPLWSGIYMLLLHISTVNNASRNI